MQFKITIPAFGFLLALTSCSSTESVKPDFITDQVNHDSDDPAIWINHNDPMKSLIIGTDKDENGALFVYDLKGNEIKEKRVSALKRPNNVDVEYGFMLGSDTIDIVATTERLTSKIRIFSLPDLKPIDNGGIPVFLDEEDRAPMGIGLYRQPGSGAIFAIVGRKSGPQQQYLWQYELLSDSTGVVKGNLVRKFGTFSGKKEIEAILVDDELEQVYYSDEGVGVRQYGANPDDPDEEKALFATEGIKDDHEGLSLYAKSDGEGYLILSDQQANEFHIYARSHQGSITDHPLVKVVPASTVESDGNEASSYAFNPLYPEGFVVAMSDDRTFQIYEWERFFSAVK